MIRIFALATLFASAALSSASAQTTPGEIHGRVVDAASTTPLSGAAVDVTPIGATKLAGTSSTSTDGTFRIQNLPLGRYRLRIRNIGFTPKVLPSVAISAASPDADAGTIGLAAATTQLEQVVVNAEKRDVELAPDRNTYVVRDMPTTRGGTAIDVLRTVPSVDVDIDNVVSLRGNSGVVVQINGRPSPMKPAQLGNFLAQLPADMVDKVEVVPNPSAKDDPEGVAGIINIVLKQETDAGTSGGLTLSGGTTGRVDVGGNLGYQRGPWTLYGSYGFLRDSRPRADAITRENLYLTPITFLDESGYRTQIPLAHTFAGSAVYTLTPHDELSSDLTYSTRTEAETYGIQYRTLDTAQVLTARSYRYSQNTNYEYNFESTLGYKHAFADKGHKLSSELRVFRGREGGPSTLEARDLALDGTPIDYSAQETAVGYEHPGENSLKLDYAQPFASMFRLETGVKASRQQFHTTLDTRVLDTTTSTYLPDPLRVSDFTYDQNVNAAYGMLSAQPGSFVLQGGLRVERATTEFHLNSTNASYDNDYNSVFPSALVAWNVDDSRQIKLSYSTRIRRPDDTDLIDPTLHYVDPLNVRVGNPYLQPEYTRSIELGLQRTADRTTMQLTPFFRHTLNAVRRISTIDSVGVATQTFANVSHSDSYGADATVAANGGRLSGFAGASVFEQVSDASNLQPGLSARSFGWTARTNASFRASPTLDFQTLLFYRSSMTVEQGVSGAQTRLSLAARKKLMGDRLSLTLRVTDPFSTQYERFTTYDPRFTQVSDRRRVVRGILLNLNWTFGKPRDDRGRNQADPLAEPPAG